MTLGAGNGQFELAVLVIGGIHTPFRHGTHAQQNDNTMPRGLPKKRRQHQAPIAKRREKTLRSVLSSPGYRILWDVKHVAKLQ